jgi:hypothetical protein
MKRNVKVVAKSKIIKEKTVFRRGPILIIYDPDATGPEDTLDPEGESDLKGWSLMDILHKMVIESGQDVDLTHGSIEFNRSIEAFYNSLGKNNIDEAERILLEDLKPYMNPYCSYLRILEGRIQSAREWEELEN